MTAEEKVYGYLGLAARGRRLLSGEFSCENAVRDGKARLVVLAGDASGNTKKKFQNMCEYYQVPLCFVGDRAALGAAIGRSFRASAAVTDEGLAKAIIGIMRQQRSLGNEREIVSYGENQGS